MEDQQKLMDQVKKLIDSQKDMSTTKKVVVGMGVLGVLAVIAGIIWKIFFKVTVA